MTQLTAEALTQIGGTVPVPAYDRSAVTVGVVHIGVGGFHRAHQAMYLDRLMAEGAALDWGICGVGVLPHDKRMGEVLAAQDHLYTLVLKHSDGRLEPRVIGSMVDYLFAADDPEAVLARMCDPGVRIVSLTITEGGYHVHPVTGEFDASDVRVQHDLDLKAVPTLAFGYLTEALRRRRAAGVPPFTVLSCDNIQANGTVAKTMLTAFARLQDPDIADHIETEVAFPSSMVDRITPVTTHADIALLAERFDVQDAWPVVCEPFTQWVLEDDFPSGRPPLEDAGVQIVDDVVPYELMKLRLLNAGHQSLGYLGRLAGYTYAHEVAQDPLFADFLLGYMEREASPSLLPVPGVDLDHYRHELIERFANPEVRDTLARLCAEASDRLPKWLLPVIRHNLAEGGEIHRSALVVAAWARYAEGVDDRGEPIEVVDRLAASLGEAARRQREEPLAFLENRELFGDLADDERFAAAYRRALGSLHSVGARDTIAALGTWADA